MRCAWPGGGSGWQPLRCLSPPWAGRGGEGGTPDGRQWGWRRGAFLARSACARVRGHVCAAGVCLPVDAGEHDCVSTKSHCMCANM